MSCAIKDADHFDLSRSSGKPFVVIIDIARSGANVMNGGSPSSISMIVREDIDSNSVISTSNHLFFFLCGCEELKN